MTLVLHETIAMELSFKTSDDEEFVISTRLVNPETRALFRLLNAAPRMLQAVEELLKTPYDEYHEMGRRCNALQALVDEIRGAE